MKVLCPRHDDTTPSCEVYEDHGYCFVCGEVVPLIELGLASAPISKERYVENIEAKMSYIRSLPEREIRGHVFRYDDRGFYICWPDGRYYKQRLFDDSSPNRYQNPSGHKEPLFWARREGREQLFLVEGQINALSMRESFINSDICSPGAASNFMSKQSKYYLTQLLSYNRIVIVVDRDAAGVMAAIEMKGSLTGKVPFVTVVLMDPDCNDLYTKYGKEHLKKEVEDRMSGGLQGKNDRV